MSDLSPKHRKFAETYLCNGFDARSAYISAGYSARSSGSESYRLLRKPEIQQFLKENLQPVVSAESILQRLVDIAFFNLTDVIEISEEGGLKVRSLSDLPRHLSSCIESITQSEGKITIKAIDCIAALRILAKHYAIDLNPNELLNQARGLGYEISDVGPISAIPDANDEAIDVSAITET